MVSTAAFAQETKACLAELAEDHDSLSVLEWDGPFNKAQIANFAVKNTQGEFLLFLNDDASILTDDALEQLLATSSVLMWVWWAQTAVHRWYG